MGLDFSGYTGFRKNPYTGQVEQTTGEQSLMGMSTSPNFTMGLTYGANLSSGGGGGSSGSSGDSGAAGAAGGSAGASGAAGAAGSQVQSSYNQANLANAVRYSTGKNELTSAADTARGLYGKAQTDIAKVGESAKADVNRGAEMSYGRGLQGLYSAGLGNTTVSTSLERGVEYDRQNALSRISEQQAGLRAGLDTQQANFEMGAGQAISGFTERRSDVGPNTEEYANRVRAAAAAQGGGATPTSEGVQYTGSALNTSGGVTSVLPGSKEWHQIRKDRGLEDMYGNPLSNAKNAPVSDWGKKSNDNYVGPGTAAADYVAPGMATAYNYNEDEEEWY
jgi:hypothetical protein